MPYMHDPIDEPMRSKKKKIRIFFQRQTTAIYFTQTHTRTRVHTKATTHPPHPRRLIV